MAFNRLIALSGLLIMVLLLSCEKTLTLPGALYQRQATLTGLMQPDSNLAVLLTYTLPESFTTTYPPIETAQVRFFENDRLLGIAAHQAGGQYQLAYHPLAGKHYRVSVEIPDYGHVEAEETIPLAPVSQLLIGPANATNPNQNPDFLLHFEPTKQLGFYWLSIYTSKQWLKLGPGCPPNVNGGLPPGCDFVKSIVTGPNSFATNSLYPDRFNAYFDSISGLYVFQNVLRFDPDVLAEQTITLAFTAANQLSKKNPGEQTAIDFFVAGTGFDRYLKTSILAYRNRINGLDQALNNPFAEPTPIYTNIQNGLGIWGAINRRRIYY